MKTIVDIGKREKVAFRTGEGRESEVVGRKTQKFACILVDPGA